MSEKKQELKDPGDKPAAVKEGSSDLKEGSSAGNDGSSANTVILFLAISFFILTFFALFSGFSDVPFLVSFAFSGVFFTLYDYFDRRELKLISLGLGILFVITIPQILKMQTVRDFVREQLQALALYSNGNLIISSASIGNALTIASLALVLYGLWKKNKELEKIKIENKELKSEISQEKEWNERFQQIEQIEDDDDKLQALTEIINSQPEFNVLGRALSLRAEFYRRKKEFDLGLADVEQIIKLKPDHAQAYNSRAIILKLKGNMEEALRDYQMAIKLKQDFAQAYYNRAILLKSLGKSLEAQEDYTKAIQLKPDYAQAYYNRAILLKSTGKLSEAIMDYTEAIKINLGYSKAYNNRGVVLKEMGKLSEALVDYNTAIRLNPSYGNAYYNRAKLFQQLNQPAKALDDYKKAVQYNPDYEEELGPVIAKLEQAQAQGEAAPDSDPEE